MKYLLKRTAAYFIDCVIVFGAVMLVLQWAILSNLRESIGITNEWFESSINMQAYVLLTISIPVWIYFAYFDSSKSTGTFGKRIMRLILTDIELKKISLGKSFIRTILKLLPWELAHIGVIFPEPLYFMEEGNVRLLTYIGIALFILYVLSIVTDKQHRTPYDKFLGTQVRQN